MTNYSKPGIRQRFIDAWNILTGRRRLASADYSSGFGQDLDKCDTCKVHEEYEEYLKNHIKSLESDFRNLLARFLGNPVEPIPDTEIQEIPRRRNFKDIQHELEMKHRVQVKEANG
jgi:hypothetical protein